MHKESEGFYKIHRTDLCRQSRESYFQQINEDGHLKKLHFFKSSLIHKEGQEHNKKFKKRVTL